MFLTGKAILAEWQKGSIVLKPFDKSQLNPNSYDVTLFPEIARYQTTAPLDPKKSQGLSREFIPEDGLLLSPGVLYLARTNEEAGSSCFVPVLNGKSSVGRLGINIHATAGFGDIGFLGTWTLEIFVIQPVIVYPNMRIGQISFHQVHGEVTQYNGRYAGQKDITKSLFFKGFPPQEGK